MTSKQGAAAPKTVALFATCINDIIGQRILKATTVLLERLGCRVVFPREQTCCGQMFTNSGYFDKGLATVTPFLEAFEPYEYIVAPSGSCVGSVREQFPMLTTWADDAALGSRVDSLMPRVYDISEFIVDVLGTTDVGAYFPHSVTYHPNCHSLRVAQIGERAEDLLRGVEGLRYVELPEKTQCCGFGGTFSLKNSDVSIAMANDKADHIESTNVDYVATGDTGCLLNFGGVLKRRGSAPQPIHIAEILASVKTPAYAGGMNR
ncbi:(Fe-S)-binding protein [Trueperella bialowiezensis]|uniref:Lactate utilization protein A n=1 Tax=Trueperella bialowiezensis TaxID=312285 RepID=A0A448PCT5_9ACTO|nr:(Fe-S)-binding protein [Trueperella bialowiezensis]VEI12735.1 Lactate utilization protein A [Trueperella bialowiezensis]